MLSIIVPVMNEEGSLRQLWDEIVAVAETAVDRFELIFIDDGSTDSSWQVISELIESDSRISGIRFRRNFGKAAALTAGMRAADGDLILMMDADLQDDPAEIPEMLKKIELGFDVVNGWKKRRLDPWHKVYPSKVFNWLVSTMTGLTLHDHNCGLKMFRSDVAAEISIYGELHRFIPVLAFARGFKVTELPVNHRSRQHGESKYGVRRFMRGLLDALTVTFLISFGRRPQHALGAVGLFFFGIGMLGLGYLSLLWCLMHVVPVIAVDPIGGRPLLAYSIAATLLGGQAMSLGLLAELIVAYTGKAKDSYSISERKCSNGQANVTPESTPAQ
ncbi:glycosyltransferase family 2 protein [Fuerstiella marisgermanici]|uniref:Undecaprenyl-phosphate 4-deoxy-4-formamido-L-arabinose transferase n=1 Tax=Fuerstiella marisgermanici TaxID=1891926 RepID=A0A1P8WN81_9PLAN|nr:glycosyltransferase family 2 protein [Fuerstiella marisgermanici]APZ95497.1 Undecaprenyl-phosphate 4-deoxy-4-formamido-L-arabinose transferase [Fuerstiella marisgermanici]